MINWPESKARRFFETDGILSFAVSNDEKQMVFVSNLKRGFDLWAMDLDNNYPYRLTFSEKMISSMGFSKDDSLIAFTLNTPEESHIYLIKSRGSEPFKVTDGPGYNDLCYLSGNKLYYNSYQPHLEYNTIFVYDIKTGYAEPLFTQDVHCYARQVFLEEGFLFYQVITDSYVRSFLYDLKRDEHIPFIPEEYENISLSLRFINRNELIFITNDVENSSSIWRYNLLLKEYEPLLKEDENISNLEISSDRRWISYVLHNGVEDYLYLFNIKTGEKIKVPTDMNVIYQNKFGVKSGKLYFSGSNAVKPVNIYYYDFKSGEIAALTNNIVSGMDEKELVEPYKASYISFDGQKIEALLYKAEKKYNGYWIIWLHEGFGYVTRKRYHGLFQYFLSRGYSIFSPNYRGSSCYGSRFMYQMEFDRITGPGLDVISGIRWLMKEKNIDENHLVLAGTNFGGYLSMLIHSRYSHLLKGAINLFGPVDNNLLPQLYRDNKGSMINNLKPLLLIQNNVVSHLDTSQTEEFVKFFRNRGVRVDYILMDGADVDNKIELAENVVNFLNSLS